MIISIASDHAGLNLKEEIKNYLTNKGIEVVDFGTNSLDSCDYPDFGYPAACAVKDKMVDFGILVCYTGIGMSMVANKVKGIRGALVGSVENAPLTREHNNANVITFGDRITGLGVILDCVNLFLSTEFLGGRHEGRVNKIKNIENENFK